VEAVVNKQQILVNKQLVMDKLFNCFMVQKNAIAIK
jgi:hypothetical protein